MNIGGIVKNSFVDYPHKISCVIFTNGCNMNCWYCHNKHLLTENSYKISEEEILNFLNEHKDFLDAVVISGGEPTLQVDLISFIKKVKKMGYLIKLDTNGSNYFVLKNLIDKKLIDYVAMDIKAPLYEYCFISSNFDIENIKKSINFLKQGNVDYEFRTTLSPDITLKSIKEILRVLIGAKNYSLQKIKYTNNEKFNDSFFKLKLKKKEEKVNIFQFYNNYFKKLGVSIAIIKNNKKVYKNFSNNIKIISKNLFKNNVTFRNISYSNLLLKKGKKIAQKYISNVEIKGL